jgi:hypothetical protein
MKRFFTLILLTMSCQLHAQVLLNEVYPIPSPGNHEFFELYNNNPGASISMDTFSIITYFEEPGNKKGFYVLDLPAMNIGPLDYFVGAAGSPLNYQGITNSNSADFNWNDTAFLHSNSGYLKKWVLSTNVPAAIDGNASYDLETISLNLNDFFNKIGGGGSSYNVFLYRNGVLANCFFGGVGGAAAMPSYIIPMPDLFVDMAGTATDHVLAFSTYGSVAVEYVIQDVGTDNGYIRLRDGYCGTWNKSSAQVNHTPGVTNGGSSLEDLSVSVAAVISPGNAQTGPYVLYDIVGALASSFPISMYVYNDNGSTTGSLDVGDTFLGSNREDVLTDGPFQTFIPPHTTGILIVVYSNAGCIMRMIHLANTNGVLPLALTDFKAVKDISGYELKWKTQSNELASSIELQSSSDGIHFISLSTMFPTSVQGIENYSFRINQLNSPTYYRVKMKDIDQKIIYSSSVFLDENKQTIPVLVVRSTIEGNLLRAEYTAQESAQASISIYNTSGSRIMSKNIAVIKGQQQLLLPLDVPFGTGIYILEVMTSTDRQTSRFLRR